MFCTPTHNPFDSRLNAVSLGILEVVLPGFNLLSARAKMVAAATGWKRYNHGMFDERYIKGIELFNDAEFFACHDELEEVWTETIGPERDFYQGLIHVAVSLFHFEGGNLGGARKMYESSRRYLASYDDQYMGIDLAKLLVQQEHAFRELLGPHDGYPTGVELNPDDIPTIDWVPTKA